jgi:hypothetical protein
LGSFQKNKINFFVFISPHVPELAFIARVHAIGYDPSPRR